MALRHRKQTNFPQIRTGSPQDVATTLDESFRVSGAAFKNVFDDLKQQPAETGVLYFGDSNTNGTWRLIISGNNLSVQRRETGSWIEKGFYTP